MWPKHSTWRGSQHSTWRGPICSASVTKFKTGKRCHYLNTSRTCWGCSKAKAGYSYWYKICSRYSVLFMVELEDEISSEMELKLCLCWSYIDDRWHLFSWEHEEEKLREFTEHLNEKHPTIKFTIEWSQTSMKFFDVTLSLIDGRDTTKLYVKPTDNYQYLNSSSCHPNHPCLNRICSDPNSFDRRCNDLQKWLKKGVIVNEKFENKF